MCHHSLGSQWIGRSRALGSIMLVKLQRPGMHQKLCGLERLTDKRPDVPKQNLGAPGEVTPAVWVGSQRTRPGSQDTPSVPVDSLEWQILFSLTNLSSSKGIL